MTDSNLESIRILLEKVKDKQDDMDSMLKEMDKTLTQLNQTVIGNPVYGQKGIVNELEDIKKYVENDKMIKNKIVGGLSVVGIIWTILLSYINHLIKR